MLASTAIVIRIRRGPLRSRTRNGGIRFRFLVLFLGVVAFLIDVGAIMLVGVGASLLIAIGGVVALLRLVAGVLAGRILLIVLIAEDLVDHGVYLVDEPHDPVDNGIFGRARFAEQIIEEAADLAQKVGGAVGWRAVLDITRAAAQAFDGADADLDVSGLATA